MIDSKDISVVVQGAIDKKLTPKCMKSIRKLLPNAEIVLSTWEDSDISGLDYDVLVENQDPKGIKHDFALYNQARSINNFNRQLVSTQNGIKKVERKYCLKLRSDLELKNVGFLKYIDKFEVRNKDYSIFNNRVLVSSIYSRENSCQSGNMFPTPFHPSDFWLFGLTQDLRDYFMDAKIQTKEEGGDWKFKYSNRIPYNTLLWRYAPEQQFCVNWVKKYYPNLQFEDWSDWNEENINLSNNILYNNFIFLDYEQSGIYSQKHSWAIKNKEQIKGLITYNHFQLQYKKYCDNSYQFVEQKSYQEKMNKHSEKVLAPFKNILKWVGELFSTVYYAQKVLAEKIKNLFR